MTGSSFIGIVVSHICSNKAINVNVWITLGETARWLQLQPSSSWPWRRKCSKFFSLCTIHITSTNILGCIWILDVHFKIVLLLQRLYLIPIRCNNGKIKICHWWLHALMTMVASVPVGNFLYTANPLQTNMKQWYALYVSLYSYVYRLHNCCQVWYVLDLGH